MIVVRSRRPYRASVGTLLTGVQGVPRWFHRSVMQ